MPAYRFQTQVTADGKIIVALPEEMKKLYSHKVEVILVDLEENSSELINKSEKELTKRWADLIGSVNAPADWAAEHDHYLYGIPKRKD